MIPVVISGGSGTRLWPVSRVKLPKQFCELFDESLQTLSLKRAEKLGQPIVLTNTDLKALTEKNIKTAESKADVLYEPMAKNTAPAIAFLCRYLELNGKSEEAVAVFPSDHMIEDETGFQSVIETAIKEANKGYVVTLGIKPSFPSTGYGYINTQSNTLNTPVDVISFKEKPNLEAASNYLKAGTYFWNAGIFIFKVSTMIHHFKAKCPEVWAVASQITKEQIDSGDLKSIYEKFPNISIDYAIMEKLKSSDLRCIPCDIGWSDVGSWDAVAGMFNNRKTDFVAVDFMSSNNFTQGLKDKVYAFIGIHNLVVVDTADALLISQKGLTQNVKDVVDQLKKLDHKAIREHTFEDRPWGRYEVLKESENFKSKVIHVEAGQQLSYQSHNQREEHWVITQGSGEVVLNEKVIPVKRGTYINIPLKAKHRIRNTGSVTMEFIEVQMGDYFGEDDIIRYQDDYKRI
ncbi:MAG: mannose-1-phosphate guanylyltransferase/mannose-6-phosphate isomerase [Bdellovibrionaceae bacterium]|nr:mannose-1-phosphate guanylyltransferase/mannose-6-phosphate isomerase [Pseudobdellovibrionaceae bacterium]